MPEKLSQKRLDKIIKTVREAQMFNETWRQLEDPDGAPDQGAHDKFLIPAVLSHLTDREVRDALKITLGIYTHDLGWREADAFERMSEQE